MTLGYIGLGKMGLNMVERLMEKGHTVIASSHSQETRDEAKEAGVTVVPTNEEIIDALPDGQKIVWIMVPYKAVDAVLEQITPKLSEGDLIIDGGNSPYKETVRRGKELAEKGIEFVDAGVSGGPSGARNGACIMVGGERELFDQLEPLFKDLSAEGGYGYMGRSGAGHFVKMVHNGIEYGMMQAIGEGFDVMKKLDFNLDLKEVARVYNKRSVIESRLVGWLSDGYEKHGVDLDTISGEVKHSGEGLWTVEAAKELGVAVPIIEGSLQFREDSTGNPSYTGQVVSTLRNQFGGHDVAK